ncbi:hypothetical protein NQ315_013219 [Exocentrus adspersus]|uniref:Uncharacterized protein n=1 Tax=Exocentrus adspersus TaxID=1586481 RepID=A0AAV8VCX8_9CUCU|nr:hypothetical protein NQ315_013219 [Exocentrus adspersus]
MVINVKYHKDHVKNFTEKYGNQYLSLKQITPEDGTAEWAARDLSLYPGFPLKMDRSVQFLFLFN